MAAHHCPSNPCPICQPGPVIYPIFYDTVQSIDMNDHSLPLEVAYDACGLRLQGRVAITRFEVEQCADQRERRRLVSAKLQVLGDALLAAMDRAAGEKTDFYAARRQMREEYQQHRTGGLGVFELKQSESKEQE